MSRWHRGFSGQRNALNDTIKVDTCHYSFVQTHRTYKTSCRAWTSVTMMRQWRLMSCNKRPTPLAGVDNGRFACPGARCIGEIRIPSPQFFCVSYE